MSSVGGLPNPITPQHVQMIENALRHLNHADDLIARCKQCGINVQEYDAASKAYRKVLEGVRNNFGGGQ